MKVIDDDDASLLLKIGADGFPLGGTVTRARDYIARSRAQTQKPHWRYSLPSHLAHCQPLLQLARPWAENFVHVRNSYAYEFRTRTKFDEIRTRTKFGGQGTTTFQKICPSEQIFWNDQRGKARVTEIPTTTFQKICPSGQIFWNDQCATNAVTVIPLITLLIPQAIIAVITFIINSN